MKNKKVNLIGAGVASTLMLAAILAPAVSADSPAADTTLGNQIQFTDVKAENDDIVIKSEDGSVLHGSWGPQNRDTYTMEEPASEAVFNSITNATNDAGEGLGDERQFVRIYEIDPKAESYKAVQSLDLEAGKKYQVVIYYHNDASSTFNTTTIDGKEVPGKGVATNTKVATWFPRSMKKGETDYVVGRISWTVNQPGAESQSPSETNPLKYVWASAKVTAKEDIKLEPITGHAYLVNAQNHGLGNTTADYTEYMAGKVELFSPAYVLASNLFTADGTMIQSRHITDWTLTGNPNKPEGELTIQTGNKKLENGLYEGPSGVVLGCDEYAGRVTYQFQTKAVGLPSELPNTGAMQIVLAGVLLLVVAGGVAFMVKTHAATRNAKGRK